MQESQTSGRLFLPFCVIYLLTYSMEQRPTGEVDRFSVSQELPRILCNPKFHYHIHKCPPPVPILSQLNPVHNPTSQFLKMHLNIFHPSKPGSPKWSGSLRFPHKKFSAYVSSLTHTCYMPRQSHYSQFYRFGEENIKLLIV